MRSKTAEPQYGAIEARGGKVPRRESRCSANSLSLRRGGGTWVGVDDYVRGLCQEMQHPMR